MMQIKYNQKSFQIVITLDIQIIRKIAVEKA